MVRGINVIVAGSTVLGRRGRTEEPLATEAATPGRIGAIQLGWVLFYLIVVNVFLLLLLKAKSTYTVAKQWRHSGDTVATQWRHSGDSD